MEQKYVIGLDFGTDSVRAVLVNAGNGEELNLAVHYYSRWARGLYCQPALSQFRQHPLDYLEGMEQSIVRLLENCTPAIRQSIAAIGIATTGSTPIAVNRNNIPLSLLPGFEDNPNAMFVLWKDHTANKEADEINELAKSGEIDFSCYSGGSYSSEWYWAKLLHLVRTDAEVAANLYTWVEHCDWMPAVLTGLTDAKKLRRSRCAAGHKAMWHKDFDGLPAETFLEQLDTKLAQVRSTFSDETYTANVSAGTIAKHWAEKLNLPDHVQICVGAFDAHIGAVGAGIEPFALVKVLGTSTCDMVVVPLSHGGLVKGICGQVDGSILPGMLGMEAGQSAFGDLYKWFEQILCYPLNSLGAQIDLETKTQITSGILARLNEDAAKLPLSENDEVALDWINGRRTPDVDHTQTAAISGLTLASSAPSIFKALVEATAFGGRAILERFAEEGIQIRKILALGGISKKSSFVLQTLANVMQVEILVVKSEQACALGAAMFAATAAGIYPDISAAQQGMSCGTDAKFVPEPAKFAIYEKLYSRYRSLGSSFNPNHI